MGWWYPVSWGIPSGGGHSTFFQVGVCGPGFQSVGLANGHLPLKRGACERKISKFGGLWAENFQIWRLVSWKFPNLGACELKFGWKLRLFRLKFPNFLKRGSCELTLLLEMGPLRAAGEAWKGGLQGRTSPYPLSRLVPPPPGYHPGLLSIGWWYSVSCGLSSHASKHRMVVFCLLGYTFPCYWAWDGGILSSGVYHPSATKHGMVIILSPGVYHPVLPSMGWWYSVSCGMGWRYIPSTKHGMVVFCLLWYTIPCYWAWDGGILSPGVYIPCY